MFRIAEYTTSKHYDKYECLKDLTQHLNHDFSDYTIVDIEKTWLTDSLLADYSPRLSLKVIIIYYEK